MGSVSARCSEYRYRAGSVDEDEFLAALGLPGWEWRGGAVEVDLIAVHGEPWGVRMAPPGRRSVPAAFVVLAAEALQRQGREPPEELLALATLALLEGLAAIEASPGPSLFTKDPVR